MPRLRVDFLFFGQPVQENAIFLKEESRGSWPNGNLYYLITAVEEYLTA